MYARSLHMACTCRWRNIWRYCGHISWNNRTEHGHNAFLGCLWLVFCLDQSITMRFLPTAIPLKFVYSNDLGQFCWFAVLDILKETNYGWYRHFEFAGYGCIGTVIPWFIQQPHNCSLCHTLVSCQKAIRLCKTLSVGAGISSFAQNKYNIFFECLKFLDALISIIVCFVCRFTTMRTNAFFAVALWMFRNFFLFLECFFLLPFAIRVVFRYNMNWAYLKPPMMFMW